VLPFREGFKFSNKNSFRTWIRKGDAEINEDSDNMDDEDSGEKMNIDTGSKNTVVKDDEPPSLEPDNDDVKPKETPKSNANTNNPPPTTNNNPPPTTNTPVTNNPPPTTNTPNTNDTPTTNTQNPPPVKKHQWFQTEDNVCVSVYIKNVKKENCKVIIKPNNLEVAITTGVGSEYSFDIELCDEIDPNNSRYDILTTKIEINLRKKSRGQWAQLEKGETSTVQPWGSIQKPTEEKVNKYPTSSNKKKDWDAIEKEAKEETKKEGDGLHNFFHDIFKGASDEQRMAMEKSFYESGGTVFSTNWDEVGKGKVKGSAPNGMEMKQWEDLNH